MSINEFNLNRRRWQIRGKYFGRFLRATRAIDTRFAAQCPSTLSSSSSRAIFSPQHRHICRNHGSKYTGAARRPECPPEPFCGSCSRPCATLRPFAPRGPQRGQRFRDACGYPRAGFSSKRHCNVNKKAAGAEAPAAQESPATTDERRYQRAALSGSWLPSSRR